MAIRIKDHKVLVQLLSVPYHAKLMEIVRWFAHRYSDTVITCGYRKDDGGVHGTIPCRGIDVRSSIFAMPEVIVKDINLAWQYDPKRPEFLVCLYHAVCPKCKHNNTQYTEQCVKCGADIKDHWHFHLQSHNNTVKNDST